MQSTLRRDLSQMIVTPIVAIVCILVITWFQIPQLHQLQQRSQMASVEETRQATQAEQTRLKLLQKVPAFGFDNLLSDWAFLSFLQYFGDEVARTKSDYSLSPEYFEIVLQRNPNFLRAYPFASTSTSLYAGMPERSIALTQKAAQSLRPNAPSGSYYVWRQIAIDQLLFLGDAQAAKRSFETAAQWANGQGNTAAATLSRQTAQFLANNPDSKSAQVSAWSMILANVPDDRTRQIAISRIKSLGGKIIENPDGSFGIVPPEKD
jgi:hypothetical protein